MTCKSGGIGKGTDARTSARRTAIYRACVENGTHYVDITGEVDWVDDMRSKYQQKAKETGATLCSFAGYDCVPCDLTTHLARKVLSEQNQGGKVDNPTLVSLESVIEATTGAFPRGTIRTTISKLGDSASFCGKLIRFASSDKKIHLRNSILFRCHLYTYRYLLVLVLRFYFIWRFALFGRRRSD